MAVPQRADALTHGPEQTQTGGHKAARFIFASHFPVDAIFSLPRRVWAAASWEAAPAAEAVLARAHLVAAVAADVHRAVAAAARAVAVAADLVADLAAAAPAAAAAVEALEVAVPAVGSAARYSAVAAEVRPADHRAQSARVVHPVAAALPSAAAAAAPAAVAVAELLVVATAALPEAELAVRCSAAAEVRRVVRQA